MSYIPKQGQAIYKCNSEYHGKIEEGYFAKLKVPERREAFFVRIDKILEDGTVEGVVHFNLEKAIGFATPECARKNGFYELPDLFRDA